MIELTLSVYATSGADQIMTHAPGTPSSFRQMMLNRAKLHSLVFCGGKVRQNAWLQDSKVILDYWDALSLEAQDTAERLFMEYDGYRPTELMAAAEALAR